MRSIARAPLKLVSSSGVRRRLRRRRPAGRTHQRGNALLAT